MKQKFDKMREAVKNKQPNFSILHF
ncbi:hypothetical protein RB2501_05290 [Robiginitalea biformata HTCC2501]|uniref:Uncharacterized protein n=1 Tax=Robiginitalea biformata (strain ATCC BAA-864 / DSM 15991 / KCTC 12146 / HTCC2501) TaxID=313596 RepID=A4CH78_ROBBH|nr:hypothetical protein RB2501_05290 [Robiginitalea biformata HTCC2501]